MYQASSSSPSRRILVVLALLLFIVALVLVIVQSFTDGRKGAPLIGSYGQGYADGFNTARDMAQTMGVPIQESVTTIVGTVIDINGNNITIEASGLFLDENVDGVGSFRIIIIDDDTQIVKSSEKDISFVDDEFQEYDRAMAIFDPESGDEPPEPPSTEEETAIAISDIAEGDVIIIIGKDGEDLLLVESITASKIVKTETQDSELDENGVEDISPPEPVLEDDLEVEDISPPEPEDIE